MKYLVIDIETGGFSKKKNGICEIAFQILDEDLSLVTEYQTLIKSYPRSLDVQEFPGQLVSYKEDAMQVNGIDLSEMESEGKSKADVIEDIYGIIHAQRDEIVCVGHNLENFDFPWMVEFFSQNVVSFHKLFTGRLDTLTLSRQLRGKGSKNDLPTLCEDYGISHESAHRALGDVKATVELMKVLRENKML